MVRRGDRLRDEVGRLALDYGEEREPDGRAPAFKSILSIDEKPRMWEGNGGDCLHVDEEGSAPAVQGALAIRHICDGWVSGWVVSDDPCGDAGDGGLRRTQPRQVPSAKCLERKTHTHLARQ